MYTCTQFDAYLVDIDVNGKRGMSLNRVEGRWAWDTRTHQDLRGLSIKAEKGRRQPAVLFVRHINLHCARTC